MARAKTSWLVAREALLAIGRGATIKEAAAVAGVSTRLVDSLISDHGRMSVSNHKPRVDVLSVAEREEIRVGIDRGERCVNTVARAGLVECVIGQSDRSARARSGRDIDRVVPVFLDERVVDYLQIAGNRAVVGTAAESRRSGVDNDVVTDNRVRRHLNSVIATVPDDGDRRTIDTAHRVEERSHLLVLAAIGLPRQAHHDLPEVGNLGQYLVMGGVTALAWSVGILACSSFIFQRRDFL